MKTHILEQRDRYQQSNRVAVQSLQLGTGLRSDERDAVNTTNTMNTQQLLAIREVCNAIVEAVELAGPMGVGSGVVYSALMSTGISLSQYQSLIAGLVRAGKLKNENHCLIATSQLIEA